MFPLLIAKEFEEEFAQLWMTLEDSRLRQCLEGEGQLFGMIEKEREINNGSLPIGNRSILSVVSIERLDSCD